VEFVDDVSDALSKTSGCPLHVGPLFVAIQESREIASRLEGGAPALQLVQVLTQPEDAALVLLDSEFEGVAIGIEAGLEGADSGIECNRPKRLQWISCMDFQRSG